MSYLLGQADASRLPLASKSVDLVFGSPPYTDARLYLEDGKDLGISRDAREWVDWMLDVTEEALRVSRGLVLWVCAGVTRDRNYWPACEGLLWEGWKRGWLCECPAFWHRVGVPGSGGDQWLRKDVEYVLAFKASAVLPWSDNTACGHPPKWAPGGEMSNRLSDGSRVNRWGAGGKQTSRDKNGIPRRQYYGEGKGYDAPAKANPGNLIKTSAGHGHLGHLIAHENEAPFPEALAEFFVKSFCPPDGTVLDCFSGSGTTVSVADRLRRNGIGFDLRMSQCLLGKRRIERPHAYVIKSHAEIKAMPLFDGFEEEAS